ncbi:MAG TPA: carboxylesterase family protein [Caulobacteraceae bacterium]
MTSRMMDQTGASRRAVLGAGSVLLAAGSAALVGEAAAQPAPSAPRPASPLGGGGSGDLFPVVETTNGKVQGIVNAGIKEFKYVPYGAPTGGANRYMPPKRPKPWAGVRECIGYGPISPQTPADLRSDYGMMIQWDRHVGDGGMGEDVLHLNVWTPGVNDGAKRAVLVSFHGGGFATGSGNGPGYDGAQLARFGDVVVVTVNHRLAAFGYTNLIDAGAPPEFAFAGVCGIMDLTASLEWVRDNIAAFGGDPGRVMIFGQSGGGAKTTSMLATPAAKGLFHRAAVQSGSQLRFATREDSAKTAAAFIDKLGLTKANVANIQKLSWRQLLSAQVAMGAGGPGGGFGPVLDGHYLTHHPFDPAAPAESLEVPMIISTALEEAALALTNFDVDEAGVRAALAKRYGDKADAIWSLYRGANPNKSPFLIQCQIVSDAGFRRSAFTQAELKAAAGRAPAYMYLWAWPSPGYDGKFGAVHGTDVSATFYNVRDNIIGVGSAGARTMCQRLASAWVAFAKTGDPNNGKIPHWPAYDVARRATMVFDTDTRVENDPRGEMRKLWAAMPPPHGLMG